MTREEYIEFLKTYDFGWPRPEAHAQAIAWAGVYQAEFNEAFDAWKGNNDPRTKGTSLWALILQRSGRS